MILTGRKGSSSNGEFTSLRGTTLANFNLVSPNVIEQYSGGGTYVSKNVICYTVQAGTGLFAYTSQSAFELVYREANIHLCMLATELPLNGLKRRAGRRIVRQKDCVSRSGYKNAKLIWQCHSDVDRKIVQNSKRVLLSHWCWSMKLVSHTRSLSCICSRRGKYRVLSKQHLFIYLPISCHIRSPLHRHHLVSWRTTGTTKNCI